MRTNDARPRGAWRRGMILMLFAVMLTGCSQKSWDDIWHAIYEYLYPDEEPVTASAEEPPVSP